MNPLHLLFALFVGLGIGSVAGFLIAKARAAARLAQAQSAQIRLQTQLETLTEARKALTDEFQVLAANALDSQSQKLSTQNREALSALLDPFGKRIVEFRQKVEQIQNSDTEQRSALKAQVEELSKQSRDIGVKADHLADALKGDNKALGNWGELALERLLESAGLQSGRDYELQVHAAGEDGKRYLPDAVLRLPGDRCIIIDSKMSLKDYMDHFNATSEAARTQSLKAHVSSMEAHIKGLAAKRYQDLEAFKDRSPDFVVMFVPSEPALALALADNPVLFERAARANIILAGPGSLLATLRLVDQLWRQENQRQSISEIFEAVGKIYDKYVNFSESMEEVDKSLEKARSAYQQAYKQLATGKGNLVGQMEKFRKENIIKPKKLPPKAFQEVEAEDSETEP